MPRFFFDVHDTEFMKDADGIECRDVDDARAEALRAAAGMAAEHAAIWYGQPWKMEVRNEAGTIVARLAFTAS